MIEICIDAAREFAALSSALIDAGAVEDALRHLLSANLPLMFPDNPWWIQAHSTGAEAHVFFVDSEGRRRTGFIDSLVGKTAIEYEKNLSVKSVYDEGYRQLGEYCAALLNRGEACSDIVGVLSDTIRWHAFSVRIVKAPLAWSGPTCGYGPDNIALDEIDSVSLEQGDESAIRRFGLFVNRHLGRLGSRRLDSASLAMDLGFGSAFFGGNIGAFTECVELAFSSRNRYGDMISSLWKSFVTRFENDGGDFGQESFTGELYMVTLAKLLCANILNGSVVGGLGGDNGELERVLNGQWFRERGFANLVEYDYFGWFCEQPHISRLLPAAGRMQDDLAAYDYGAVAAQDLFGSIVAGLARADRRLLLGQEFTPQWTAQRIVAKMIGQLPEGECPNFVDMCCGSGVFVVETLKQTIARLGVTAENCSPGQLDSLMNCVVGFDIDPLAVLLAKLNWAIIMHAFMGVASGEMTIPVYHADSLFATAPLTRQLADGFEERGVEMDFDGEKVLLPGFLISPEFRRLFDALVQLSHGVAKAMATNADANAGLARIQAEEMALKMASKIIMETNSTLTASQEEALVDCCLHLTLTLEALQREGRNGIWPFLLENSYRPGMLRGQFNGIVSNPPWMAMSKLANNPYRDDVLLRAERYGIKPSGSAHLHAELATVFLLSSLDVYLKPGGHCGVVMPETLLNGYQHEPFRNQAYLHSPWPVGFQTQELWELPADTFKNKAIAVFGQKSDTPNPAAINGKRVFPDRPDEPVEYRLLRQGKRSAWSCNPLAKSITDGVLEKVPFLQGADIMPRTLVFHKAERQPGGKWSLMPIPRQHDALSYLVSLAKESTGFTLSAQNIDDSVMFACYLSNHVLPFLACRPASAFLPMKRANGMLVGLGEAEIAGMGSATEAAFGRVFSQTGESPKEYFDRLNTRNKLNPQQFGNASEGACLVLVGAGGEHICAACVPIGKMTAPERERTVVDQTLYWHLAQSEDEAMYLCGMLNSQAIGEIIAEFQPEGAMGKRHVHKLPYEVTPPFDPDDPAHLAVAEKTRGLVDSLRFAIGNSNVARYLDPSSSTLQVRRTKIREFVNNLDGSGEYERACRAVYGI